MSDVADYCDECRAAIYYGGSGTTAYLLPTGETFDDHPVVRVLCPHCHEGAA